MTKESKSEYQSYVVNLKKVAYDGVINQNNRKDGMYAGNPWPVRAGETIKSGGDLGQFHGETVAVFEEMLLNIGSIWCHVTIRDEAYWIAKDALEVPTRTYTFSKTPYLAQLNFTEHLPIYENLPYSTPTAHVKRRSIRKNYFKENVVQVFEEATSSAGTFVHVIDNRRTIWINKEFITNEGTVLPLINITGDVFKLAKGRTAVVPVTIHLLNQTPVTAWGRITVQGASSASWARHNYEIQLFKDVTTREPLKLKLFDWQQARSKFSLRSDYMDPTHVRTQTALNLWRAILKTDDAYVNTVRDTDFLGTTAGYPVNLSMNGETTGIYNLMTYLDANSLEIDSRSSSEIMIMGRQGHTDRPGLVFSESHPHLDGSDFDIMSHQSAGNKVVRESIYRLTSFIHEASDAEFYAKANDYFDPIKVINYFLFVIATDAYDNMTHNNVMYTYDGQKWLFTILDLDAVFMVGTAGHKVNPESKNHQKTVDDQTSPLWEKMKRTFATEIQQQWQALRQTVLQSDLIMADAEAQAGQIKQSVKLDQALWESPANWFTLDYLKDYLPKHLAECDAWVDQLTK
ncbi:CotH kinase family protein [Secundilactobacillus malefermentans]|uniref:CotH kinase family protein n=1 Tax=Secundilactobacillus malefermentans TaxID=176292 RepID=UPI0011CB13B1|nr:CotH kinase family protein [Secundilactobacillus malefermentans]QEA31445.1 hypothetical protein FGL90_04205 [Secundilactobacillus malefermentans]